MKPCRLQNKRLYNIYILLGGADLQASYGLDIKGCILITGCKFLYYNSMYIPFTIEIHTQGDEENAKRNFKSIFYFSKIFNILLACKKRLSFQFSKVV